MSTNDVQCPYCEKYFDVDYSEQGEGDCFEYTCPHCEKMVFITLSFLACFDIDKAPCLNGGEHNWFEVNSSFHGKYKECNCGATKDKISDKEAWEIQEKWMKELREKQEKENVK